MICSKANKFQTVSNNILNSNSNFFTTENAKNLINRKKEKNQKKSKTTQFRGIIKFTYIMHAINKSHLFRT
jgi:hypothetical protein